MIHFNTSKCRIIGDFFTKIVLLLFTITDNAECVLNIDTLLHAQSTQVMKLVSTTLIKI